MPAGGAVDVGADAPTDWVGWSASTSGVTAVPGPAAWSVSSCSAWMPDLSLSASCGRKISTKKPTATTEAAMRNTRSRESANPEAAAQAQQLQQQGLESITADTSGIANFPLLVAPFREGFTASIDLVFLVAAAVVAIGFFVLLFLPQVALSDKSGIQALQEDEGQPGTAVTPEVPADQPTQSVGASAPTSTAPPSGTAEDPRR